MRLSARFLHARRSLASQVCTTRSGMRDSLRRFAKTTPLAKQNGRRTQCRAHMTARSSIQVRATRVRRSHRSNSRKIQANRAGDSMAATVCSYEAEPRPTCQIVPQWHDSPTLSAPLSTAARLSGKGLRQQTWPQTML